MMVAEASAMVSKAVADNRIVRWVLTELTSQQKLSKPVFLTKLQAMAAHSMLLHNTDCRGGDKHGGLRTKYNERMALLFSNE